MDALTASYICVGLGAGNYVCIGLGGMDDTKRVAVVTAAQALATSLGTDWKFE